MDLELDTNQLRETENFLDKDKREFISQTVIGKLQRELNPEDYFNQLIGTLIGGAISVILHPANTQYASNTIRRSFNPQNMLEESIKRINSITRKLPPERLVTFHRECMNHELNPTIHKWLKRLPSKRAIFLGRTAMTNT